MQPSARQAKDHTLIEEATEIRLRAERRAGEMLRDMATTGERVKSGGQTRIEYPKVTLSEIGVSKMESSKWQLLARLDEARFEERVKAMKRQAASAAGVRQAAEIIEAAERDPVRFGRLVEEMDRVKNIAGPYRTLQRMLDGDRVAGLVVRVGRVRTLVIDPPWQWDMSGRAALDYAMMSLDDIAALSVADWVEDDAHLWLWTTNAHMTHACRFMAGWGFVQKAVLTWVKPPPFGIGAYLRNSTEHALFGVRGELATKAEAASIPTHFEAPRGKHSEKPERFYEIVRAACQTPYGEAFQRSMRADFANV
jgi:N6-adenosine-specific RNA methylase IME4